MTNPQQIGLIDPIRLRLIPIRARAAHEFCFHLHDQMALLLTEGERNEVNFISYRFESDQERDLFLQIDDPIDFFRRINKLEIERKIVVNTLVVALFADFLHFLYEALTALEKRKFTVSMALLRKPLRENLMFSTWLRGDGDDFYNRLMNSPADQMESRHLTNTRRLELFEKAISRTPGADFASADRLNTLIFDKASPESLAPLFDKAMHLVTSRSGLRTEKMNLNFIFKDRTDDDIYDTLYHDLSYILMYANVVMSSLYGDMEEIRESRLDYLRLTSLGAFTSLFSKSRVPLLDALNRSLKEFLICPHCGEGVRLRKSNAARLFLTETLDCQKCSSPHHFPLYWLLSQTKWRMNYQR